MAGRGQPDPDRCRPGSAAARSAHPAGSGAGRGGSHGRQPRPRAHRLAVDGRDARDADHAAPPVVQLSGTAVELPPGAFLQATAFGEAELAAAVVDWGEGARSAADLYAGLGTLTFALAGRVRRVLACESDPPAVAALRRAAAGRNITVVERDLVRRPLQPAELDHDLVVLDPPRAGAAAQCAALADPRFPRVIYASCHPESFARDARMLVDGGFALGEVRPIDQFLFSAEIELVALFTRTLAPGRRR